jgi:hypothetical protein
VSLYIYDTIGDIEKINDGSVIFEKIDFIFQVVNPTEENLKLRHIGMLNDFIRNNIFEYSGKYRKMKLLLEKGQLPEEKEHELMGSFKEVSSPKRFSPKRSPKRKKKSGSKGTVKEKTEDELEFPSPLHINGGGNGFEKKKADDSALVAFNKGNEAKNEEDLIPFPKIFCVFTHEDVIAKNGLDYQDMIHNKVRTLMANKVIKNAFFVSAKKINTIQNLFRVAIQEKIQFKKAFVKGNDFQYDSDDGFSKPPKK